ncbi:MAG TPA: SRPBCC family protein [Actinomycetota bacterium]|nr:SRPBCC family protein [Actinomycetota bacterium]
MPPDRPLGYRTQTSVTSSASPEVVYETIADLRNHLDWSGERASSDGFKLLSVEAPEGPAAIGTTFTSTGAADNGTFADRSEVTVATRPSAFVIETDAHLDRTRGRPWDAHFVHRYDIEPDDAGSRITYTETIERVSYVPYWLQPGIRSIFKVYVNRADRRQLANLARLAEERSTG